MLFRSAKSFAAKARVKGQWRDIAIQVEEVNAKGDYVLDGGLPFTKGTDDGIVDGNDELVLDGAELGDDFTLADVANEDLKAAFGSWKVGVCRGEKRVGFALVQSLRVDPKPFSAKAGAPAAVRFDEQKGEIVTDLYRYKFKESNPVLLGEVALKHDDREIGRAHV